MNSKFLVSIFFMLAISVSSFAQDNIFTGTWKLTVDYPRGQHITVFHIKKTDQGYMADCDDDQFSITVANGKINWEFSRITPNGKINYQAEGTRISESKYVGQSTPLAAGNGEPIKWMMENFRDE